jgi:hypothetical protein
MSTNVYLWSCTNRTAYKLDFFHFHSHKSRNFSPAPPYSPEPGTYCSPNRMKPSILHIMFDMLVFLSFSLKIYITFSRWIFLKISCWQIQFRHVLVYILANWYLVRFRRMWHLWHWNLLFKMWYPLLAIQMSLCELHEDSIVAIRSDLQKMALPIFLGDNRCCLAILETTNSLMLWEQHDVAYVIITAYSNFIAAFLHPNAIRFNSIIYYTFYREELLLRALERFS